MLTISVAYSFSLMSRYSVVHTIFCLFFLMLSDIRIVPVVNFYG